MTIGIAATGPWAGAGILAGLRAVEAVGQGGICGFVSLAVLTAEQKLLRAETQNGGTRTLFADQPPEEILKAPYAGLISSGPDRPTPLSQFVTALPGVGIVTGHRMPQARTGNARRLNALILEGMRSGASVQKAIDDVIAAHPGFDAGFVALSAQGEIGLGNMPSVLRLSDQGSATSRCNERNASVATIYNGIQPHKAIGLLATEIALHEIRFRDTEVWTITLSAGIELRLGEMPEIHIDGNFCATQVLHPEAPSTVGESSFGMGDKVRVMRFGEQVGWLGREPFMVVRNGTIITLDGKSEIKLPVLLSRESDP